MKVTCQNTRVSTVSPQLSPPTAYLCVLPPSVVFLWAERRPWQLLWMMIWHQHLQLLHQATGAPGSEKSLKLPSSVALVQKKMPLSKTRPDPHPHTLVPQGGRAESAPADQSGGSRGCLVKSWRHHRNKMNCRMEEETLPDVPQSILFWGGGGLSAWRWMWGQNLAPIDKDHVGSEQEAPPPSLFKTVQTSCKWQSLKMVSTNDSRDPCDAASYPEMDTIMHPSSYWACLVAASKVHFPNVPAKWCSPVNRWCSMPGHFHVHCKPCTLALDLQKRMEGLLFHANISFRVLPILGNHTTLSGWPEFAPQPYLPCCFGGSGQ